MNLTSPKNWKTVKLADVAEKIAMGPFGSNIKVDTFVEEGIPVISGNHLREGRLKDNAYNFVTLEHADKLRSANVFRGDVIFTHAGNIGQVAYIPKNSKYERYVLSQRQFYLRCNKEKIIPEFITYFFTSRQGQHVLLANANQTGVPSIAQPASYLKSIEVALPEVEEQKEIAAILGSLDDKIELLRRENKILESIAQAMFREWFVEFRFPGYEGVKVDVVPEGWKVGNIYDLMKIQYGFPFKSELFNESRNGFPLIRIRDLKEGKPSIYTNETCGDEYIIKRGDIIAGMDAEFRPCIWKGENGVLNQRVCKFISNDESISNYFIYQVIKPHLEFFERTKVGTTVSHLGKADLDSIEVVIPPKDLMISFSNAIDSSYKKLINNFSEIQTLSRLRDDLLNKIFNL